MFQSRKQDYFNWKSSKSTAFDLFDLFQSRKQDYFNWKYPAIELLIVDLYKFQSRKQDYFNWKA